MTDSKQYNYFSKEKILIIDYSTLPSCPFFLRVSVPTQPSLLASFLELSRFKEPVGELEDVGLDAMFLCETLLLWL